ncbi:hypothetical protein ACFWNR_27855 [Streptomyces virginiae]|uniref:hypothetical protein n=1 Tax=Streptomyces TaxID=1883 RepID=UPI003659F006
MRCLSTIPISPSFDDPLIDPRDTTWPPLSRRPAVSPTLYPGSGKTSDSALASGLLQALGKPARLPEITLAALRRARADEPDFPPPMQRVSTHLYRVGDLKKWARNLPRAAPGTTSLD